MAGSLGTRPSRPRVRRGRPAWRPPAAPLLASAIARPALTEPANVTARDDFGALPVLALDLATRCGFALRTSRCIASGTADFAERRNETRGDRLWRFQQWIAEFHSAQPLSMVAYEKVQGHMRGAAQTCYAQFEGVLLAWCAKRRVAVHAVNPKTLKRVIAGTGNADKAQMMAAVRAHGYTPADHNEADALAVLIYATNRQSTNAGTRGMDDNGRTSIR